jgi:dTDP-glucose 4,6-dehydratase
MLKVLMTGGCGFIGTNFIKYLLTDSEIKNGVTMINVDKMTYAGKGKNLEHACLTSNPNYIFIMADICDRQGVDDILSKYLPDVIFNFAAESHVDRSIEDSDLFEKSNFLGASNLFKSALKNNIKKIIQISTDEVYGSIKEGSFSEEDKLNPTNPYSATKAAAEILAISLFKTHNLPVIITRSANNFGPYQFPEKILPLFITNLIDGKKVPLMWSEQNPGLNVRDWLHVDDNCRAIWFVANNGKAGEVYNIPGENEKTNIEVTKKLLDHFKMDKNMIEKVQHRKSHDFRYSINGKKIEGIGFRYLHRDFNHEIGKLIEWYKQNPNWWRPLKQI